MAFVDASPSDRGRHRRSRRRRACGPTIVALLKPRVMSLVVFTGLVGIMLAPGHICIRSPRLRRVLCIAIGAGCVGALNMWYDADIDAIMTRTANAADPGGPRQRAARRLAFGVIAVGRFSVGILGLVDQLRWRRDCWPSRSSSTSSSTRCG